MNPAAPKWPNNFERILLRHLVITDTPLDPDFALADLGLDSLRTVSLVMELEDALGVSIPDHLLVPDTFRTARDLWAVVTDLLPEPTRT